MQATLAASPELTQTPPVRPAMERNIALDAFRGLIMILLVAHSFGFRSMATHPSFAWIAAQFDHVAWEGAVFYDLIQPAFMFMVGTAMPFAIAARQAEGWGFGRQFRHVAARSLRLVLLSQILICVSGNKLQFQLINVLSQIAFTYFLVFLILQLRPRMQAVAAVLLLALHTALFMIFPGPEGAFSKQGNIGAVIDRAVLGYNYNGLYVTINFISSTVTTLFGAWCGMLLARRMRPARVCAILAAVAAAAFAVGLALSSWIPIVKRIWTASFTLYSAGWVLLMLLAVYAATEVAGWKRLAFPAIVIGANSIFIYSIDQVLYGWLSRAVAVFTGRYDWIGIMAPVAQACTVLLVMWSLCYWLYRRRIFFKL